MRIVELKCPNCGAKLQKTDKKNAHCSHCGSSFLIEEIEKEQKEIGKAGNGGINRLLAWSALIGIAIGILGLFAVSAQMRSSESKRVIENAVLREEEQEWSAFFEAFIEKVYGQSCEKISEGQLKLMTHLHIFLENDCRVAEYSMEGGTLERVELSDELAVDYSDVKKLKGLKSLDIGRSDLAAGDLAELEDLTEIWCGNTPEELLEIVKDPQKITVMGCYWTSSIAKVDLFENLEHLYIENPGISDKLTDISGLGALKKLKVLEIIDGDAITDFGVLYSLSGLEELTIDSESLKDVSFLDNMDSLQRLKIEDSIVLDFSPLQDKTSLKEVALIDNYEAVDYDALGSLTELESLELELCSVSQMPDLSGWKKLKSLMIRGAQDISFLQDLPTLESLYIAGCDCSAYEVLGELHNVETLKMSSIYGNIESLDVLTQMKGLKSLDISSMSLYGNVECIFGIPGLEELNISDCSSGLDFEAMPENASLKCLHMDRMELWENISVAYDGMITYLDYDKVQLADHMDFIKKFPNLEEVYMQSNKLTEVSFAENLPNLRKLDITGNYVTDLRPLGRLEHLEIVWCGENSISQGMDLGEDVIVIADSEADDDIW